MDQVNRWFCVSRPHFLFMLFGVFPGSLVRQDSQSGESLSVGPQLFPVHIGSLLWWDAWSSGVLLQGVSSLAHLFLCQKCAHTPPSGVVVVQWCLLHR